MPSINKDLIDSLVALAEEETTYDRWEGDLSRCDSLDDAYEQGVEDGEIENARLILGRMGIDYTVRKEE